MARLEHRIARLELSCPFNHAMWEAAAQAAEVEAAAARAYIAEVLAEHEQPLSAEELRERFVLPLAERSLADRLRRLLGVSREEFQALLTAP